MTWRALSGTRRWSCSSCRKSAGLDIVTDGEAFRQHFVHGILEHVDEVSIFRNKKRIGIRNDCYEADRPRVVAPIACAERFTRRRPRTRATRCTLKFTMPGPIDDCGHAADEHYGIVPRSPWSLPRS